jgi:hypothetical protein
MNCRDRENCFAVDKVIGRRGGSGGLRGGGSIRAPLPVHTAVGPGAITAGNCSTVGARFAAGTAHGPQGPVIEYAAFAVLGQ